MKRKLEGKGERKLHSVFFLSKVCVEIVKNNAIILYNFEQHANAKIPCRVTYFISNPYVQSYVQMEFKTQSTIDFEH